MAAIDLLLNWSPASERMHQVVLAGLFRHSALLEMLGIPGEPVGLEIETQNRLYDFTISMNFGPNVHFELKVDSALEESQIRRQIAALGDGDLLVYVLLGVTRYDWRQNQLERLVRTLETAPRSDVVRMVDLGMMRQAMLTLAERASDYDHRDLAVAYGSLLRKLNAMTDVFATKPINEWVTGGYEWYGFFGEFIRRFNLTDAGMHYVPNQSGGFVGCWWAFTDLPLAESAEAYLQFEEARLCFKVGVYAGENAVVRNRFCEAVVAAADELDFPVKRSRFKEGKWMTVAVFDGDYQTPVGETFVNWEHTTETVRRAKAVLDRAVEIWRDGGAGLSANA